MIYFIGIICGLMFYLSHSAMFAFLQHGCSEDFNNEYRLKDFIFSTVISIIPVIGWLAVLMTTKFYYYGFYIGDKVYFCRRKY